MILRDHPSRDEVRKHLVDNGFVTGFASPGRPELWLKSGSPKLRYAVQREIYANTDVCRWHIIPYPEPATCTPAQLAELTRRDGEVLNGGKEPEPINEFAWLELA